jgi:hypothetical protein
MTAVYERMRVELDAESLWQRVGAFGALADWHPQLVRFESYGERPGAWRNLELRDGQRQFERLDEVDPVQHLYRYSTRCPFAPNARYTSEFRIHAASQGSSVVSWSAHFEGSEADEAGEIRRLREFLRSGLENLRNQVACPSP